MQSQKPSSVTTLFVWSAPKFILKPPDRVINSIGGSLVLNCSATGETLPIISWKRSGGAWEGERMKVRRGTLTISGLTESDSGIYICEAKGPHFAIEARTHLELRGKCNKQNSKRFSVFNIAWALFASR